MAVYIECIAVRCVSVKRPYPKYLMAVHVKLVSCGYVNARKLYVLANNRKAPQLCPFGDPH